jgi:hypothetical protein
MMRLSLDVPVSLDGWWGPASLVAWAIAQTLAPLTLRFALAVFKLVPIWKAVGRSFELASSFSESALVFRHEFSIRWKRERAFRN